MAGQSGKKNKIKQQSSNTTTLIFMGSVTAFYLILNIYYIFTAEEVKITKADILSFLYFTGVNALFYKLLDVFRESYFYLPLIDILIIHLTTMAFVNFHWKCWFIYLVIPGYLLYLAGGKVFEHVKTVGKADEGEVIDPRQNAPNSDKQKKKIVKVK
jgi:hypothetical protein